MALEVLPRPESTEYAAFYAPYLARVPATSFQTGSFSSRGVTVNLLQVVE